MSARRTDTTSALGGRLTAAARAVRWYVGEVMGEGDYARYLAHHDRQHPGEPAMDRRAFERWRMDEREREPQGRCC